jgi:Asp-tRNA(Asn)/Glu-tRNA(Gln) amidotransferase A subunit family amidase
LAGHKTTILDRQGRGSELVVATDRLWYTPATELGRLIRTRELSPVELTEQVLERVERLNPTLSAFITVTPDLARAEARAAEDRQMRGELRGPLDGIPYSIKDIEDTAGIRTTYGSKWFEQHVPAEDGLVVSRLRAMGGCLLGKTNTPHFGHKFSSDNLVAPPGRNPWSPDRTCGGSSGGAAAAVASGMGPVAQGSDGGGSIRNPASWCGVVGLKTTSGLVPRFPTTDFWGNAVVGPIARTVRDAALLLQVMGGPDERDPLSLRTPSEDYLAACDGGLDGVRVVYSDDLGYAPVDPEVRAITTAAARRFADFGCTFEERDPTWFDPAPFHKVASMVGAHARFVDRAAEHPEWIEPSLLEQIVAGSTHSTADYVKARDYRGRLYTEVRTFFETCDLLLMPVMPVAAWGVEHGSEPTEIDGQPTPSIVDRVPFTYLFNQTGHPAASVPCGFTSDGLPVGLQIVGRWYAEPLILRAAACFEAAQPWAQRTPNVE